MSRPLIQLGVADLQAMFAKSKTDLESLMQLEHELRHRQVPRAVALLDEVRAAIQAAPSSPSVSSLPLSELLQQPPTKAQAPAVVPPPTSQGKTPATPAAKPAQAIVPTVGLEDAYGLLKASAGSTWESIEQTRRQLIQQSHPSRLKSVSAERHAQVLAEARRINAAYDTLFRFRCTTR